jgi:hypothetical protein
MKVRRNLNNASNLEFSQLDKSGRYVVYNQLADAVQLVTVSEDSVTSEYHCILSDKYCKNRFRKKDYFISSWQVVIGEL